MSNIQKFIEKYIADCDENLGEEWRDAFLMEALLLEAVRDADIVIDGATGAVTLTLNKQLLRKWKQEYEAKFGELLE